MAGPAKRPAHLHPKVGRIYVPAGGAPYKGMEIKPTHARNLGLYPKVHAWWKTSTTRNEVKKRKRFVYQHKPDGVLVRRVFFKRGKESRVSLGLFRYDPLKKRWRILQVLDKKLLRQLMTN